jgi:hypothetical protein
VNAAARLGVGWVAEVRSGPAVYQRDGAIGVARDERGATVWGCAAFVLLAAMCLLLTVVAVGLMWAWPKLIFNDSQC